MNNQNLKNTRIKEKSTKKYINANEYRYPMNNKYTRVI